MMKKTIFGKFLAIAMIFAGFSLTSCDEKDNAIIDGQVYVKPEVQLVDGGAVIKATTISDINRMLARIRKDVFDAGEPFAIKINAPALTTTLLENTISLPTANGTDIIVEFTNPIATSDDAPLIIQSIGVADNAWPEESNNVVEINFAAGTSDIDLGLNMPKSTVTLKGATIDELVALTAKNTLIIENGVTVNWLQLLKDTHAVVKEGGKVLGAIADNGLDGHKKGVQFGRVWNNEIPKEEPTEDDYYYVQNAKVIKNEDGNLVPIRLIGSEDEEQENVPEIIITDGAYAWVDIITEEGEQPTYVNITGEGNATMMPNGADWGSGPGLWAGNRLELDWVMNLTNVTVDYSKYLKFDSETWKYIETELIGYEETTEISLPINSENCTFKAKRFFGSADKFSEDIVLSTHKGSTFDNLGYEDEVDGIFYVIFPEQSKDRKTFNLSFDSCEFEQAGFNTWFNGDDEKFDGFKAYMTFDNSKVGGKAITKNTEMITNVGNRYYEEKPVTSTFFVIDGVTYVPVHVVEPENKWILNPVEEE